MSTIQQVRVQWTGMKGGPGVSTFYFDGPGPPPVSVIRTMFDGFKAVVPSAVKWTFPSSGLTLDSTTGFANGNWSGSAVADLQATSPTAYAGPVGGVLNWRTGHYVNGRELRGKTFLVPLQNGVFASDGTISSGTAAGLATTAAAAFGAGSPLIIWSRHLGTTAPVTSVSMPTKAVVLRSRRD